MFLNYYRKNIFVFLSLIFLLCPGCVPAKKLDKTTRNSAFPYREIFLPEGTGKSALKAGLNSVDNDWGIWGHNLRSVLPENYSEEVFAKKNGEILKSQFCFSSEQLYQYISDYIRSDHGEEVTTRISIIPNDNDIVCLCEVCVEKGNTAQDASPSVFALINRLAGAFPAHIFYTSDYKTTTALPADTLPENAGVMISAINFPLQYDNPANEAQFFELIDKWKSKTDNVLVWDYINNFDDYFTPFPVFGIMQKRLGGYRDHNISGIFLNGSGYEPSSLSRLKTVVLDSLTSNPQTDWRALLIKKATEYYPVAGKAIADFMIIQEDFVKANNTVLPLYEGINVAIKRYLPQEAFIEFHNNLRSLRGQTKGEERKEIDKLLSQLALTRLEIDRLNSNFTDSDEFLAELDGMISNNILSYNESEWRLDRYIKDYKYLRDYYNNRGRNNKLKGVNNIKALTPLDEDYQDVSLLTDGKLGMPSNYHNGHLIISSEEGARFSIQSQEDATKVSVWLSYNPAYKIELPERVTLSGEDMPVQILTPEYPSEASGHLELVFTLPEGPKGDLYLNLHKKPESRMIAIEEIEIQ